MSQKIQLNLNWECLSKMLGDNPEVHLQLAKDAIEHYTQKHIKAICVTQEYQKLIDRLAADFNQKCQSFLLESDPKVRALWSKPLQLSDEGKKIIREAVSNAMKEYIREAFDSSQMKTELDAMRNQIISWTKEQMTIEISRQIKSVLSTEFGRSMQTCLRQLEAKQDLSSDD